MPATVFAVVELFDIALAKIREQEAEERKNGTNR
nr:MAG TPA: hypothetical protein [Caudoviricetes sp.]